MLARRADDLAAGRWKDLLAEVLRHPPKQVHAPLTECQEELRRVHNAQARIKLGQVSRARYILTGAALAPRTDDTFNLLQDTRPQQHVRRTPQAVMEYRPDVPLALSWKTFTKCLRESPSGSSPGPGGCTNEMLRVCLDDEEVLQWSYFGGTRFRARRCTNRSITRVHVGNHDGVAKERWRCARNRHRNEFSPTRCQNVSATVRTGSGEGLCSISSSHFPPEQNNNGHGSPSDSAFD